MKENNQNPDSFFVYNPTQPKSAMIADDMTTHIEGHKRSFKATKGLLILYLDALDANDSINASHQKIVF